MAREIKFRLIRDGEIVGYEVHATVHIDEYDGEVIDVQYWHDSAQTKPMVDAPIHRSKDQFTSLKDKNGKGEDLYAGDIMKDDSPLGGFERDHPRRGLGVIVWDNSSAAWCLEWGNSDGMKCRPLLRDMLSRYGRRIGNIHETPELLNG